MFLREIHQVGGSQNIGMVVFHGLPLVNWNLDM